MPVFHFILHAYRSWGPDHPDGYVQRGESGVKRPDEPLAARRDNLANAPRVVFDLPQMKLLVDEVVESCRRRRCVAHGAAATASHVHIVASWTAEVSADDIQEGLKSGLGYCLSREEETKGNRWFSRGGEPKRVADHAHLYHLLHDYLPKHAEEEGGMFRNFDEERRRAKSP